jgi:imidazole glycerol-phosphate synthase subunit HisH
MTKSVAVVDYGAGNVLNVVRAFLSQGIDAELVADPQALSRYSHVVLPGVGSFRHGMTSLSESGLGNRIQYLVQAGKPVLGICLGMHLLANLGFEDGTTPGLGLIPGEVSNLREILVNDSGVRVPHTGWAQVVWRPAARLLSRVGQPLVQDAYFNHSFFLAKPARAEVVATVQVGSREIPAAVERGSVLAVQFHPEKSGPEGLRLLRDWKYETDRQ